MHPYTYAELKERINQEVYASQNPDTPEGRKYWAWINNIRSAGVLNKTMKSLMDSAERASIVNIKDLSLIVN